MVTGAAGALGRRLCTRLAADPTITQVLALDRQPAPAGDRPVDLLTDDLEALFAGVGSVVHLASVFGPALDDDPEVQAAADVTMARRVLAAAAAAGVGHVTILSSATVYGPWRNNPVPLTEDSPLRPDPGLAFAVQKAEIERIAADWHDDHPEVALAILRPALTVAEDHSGWLARSLRAAGALREHEGDPPTQFLHLDDLASAIDQVRTARTDGTFNVAPDGWLTPSEFRDLAGANAGLRAPRWLVDKVAALRWRFRLAPTPPGTQAYAHGSFVVANDRLRATGWEPTQTNEESYVAAVPAGPWATVSPRRRQEPGPRGAGVGVAGIGVGRGGAGPPAMPPAAELADPGRAPAPPTPAAHGRDLTHGPDAEAGTMDEQPDNRPTSRDPHERAATVARLRRSCSGRRDRRAAAGRHRGAAPRGDRASEPRPRIRRLAARAGGPALPARRPHPGRSRGCWSTAHRQVLAGGCRARGPASCPRCATASATRRSSWPRLIEVLLGDRPDEAFVDALHTLAIALVDGASRVGRGRWAGAAGRCAEFRGDHRAMEAQVQAALAADPQYWPALLDAAWFAEDRGDAVKAMSLLTETHVPAFTGEIERLGMFTRTGDAKVGRNDPCPCGSGRKYKACCLGQGGFNLADRSRWLMQKAQGYAARSPQRAVVDELVLAASGDFRAELADGYRMALDEYPMVVEVALFEGRLLQAFLEQRGHLLPADERALAEQWLDVPLAVCGGRRGRPRAGVDVSREGDGAVTIEPGRRVGRCRAGHLGARAAAAHPRRHTSPCAVRHGRPARGATTGSRRCWPGRRQRADGWPR